MRYRKRTPDSLSEESKQSILKSINDMAYGSGEDDNGRGDTSLFEGKITTPFVRKLTKVKGIEDVAERNTELTKRFQGYIQMYGFESMYDMYIYAMSCDVIPEDLRKAGRDYSKLTPVKRKVTRNGKEHEITVYVDPNKDDPDEEDSEEGQGGQGRGSGGKKHARDHKTKVTDTSSEIPDELAKIKIAAQKMPQGNKPFQEDSQYYLSILGDNGDIVGVVGYSKDGEYLKMDFYRSNGEVPGVAAKGLFELMTLAHKQELGVKMPDEKQAVPLYTKIGMEQGEDGYWYKDYNSLKEVMDITS